MKLVGAGLRRNVHLGDAAAVLSAEDARLDLELLQGINGGQKEIGVEVRIGIFHAIKRVVIEMDALAGHIQSETVARAAHALLALRGSRTIRRGAGNQRGKLQVVATVERQLDDALVFDHRAHRRSFSIQHGGAGGDIDDFGNITDLNREVDSHRLAGLQLDGVAHLGTETGRFHFYGVDARQKSRSRIETLGVRLEGTLNPGGRIGNGDGGTGDGGTGGVGNGATDFAGTGLAKGLHSAEGGKN